MSKISLEGNVSGSGTLTIASPNTNSNFTLSLPTNTGTIITQNSTPAFASTIGVGGATAAASGAGITFPATQSASSDANTLDDYEEGTWTPSVRGSSTAGTVTYNYQAGSYTKIGRLIYIWMDLEVASFSGGAGNLEIPGVPFASANISTTYSVFQPWSVVTAWGQTYTTPTGFMNPNTTVMLMYTCDDAHANFAAMKVNQTGRIAGYWVMQTN
jgi:hypothetical protein